MQRDGAKTRAVSLFEKLSDPTVSDCAKMAGESKAILDVLMNTVKNIEKKVEKIPNIDEQLVSLNFEIKQICSKQEELISQVGDMDTKIKNLEAQCNDCQHVNAMLKKELTEQKEKNIKLECQSRRNNLLFGNLSESTPENCEEKVRNFIKVQLGLSEDCVSNLRFERVHRLGSNPLKGRIRPIIACFTFHKQKQHVWQQRQTLYEKQNRKQQQQREQQQTVNPNKFWMAEDFPDEIQNRRKILKPILQQAIKMKKRAYLVVDKLIIDQKTYTVDNLFALPDELSPVKLATPSITEDIIAFTGAASPLSYFHPASFVMHGKTYLHSEQY
jgi:hypothetical protein